MLYPRDLAQTRRCYPTLNALRIFSKDPETNYQFTSLGLELRDGGDNLLAESFERLYLVHVGHVEDEVLNPYGA